MEQKPYHHGDLAHALVDGAIQLLSEIGHENLSLRAVAKRAGVSANAPYRHFADKDALLAAVAEQGFRELTCRFREASQADDELNLDDLAREYVAFARDSPALYRLMFSLGEGFLPYPSLCDASGETFYILIRAIQRESKVALTQSQAVRKAVAVWSLVHGYATLRQSQAFAFIDESAIPSAQELRSEVP